MLVDLPEPVGPQNSTSPCLRLMSSRTDVGHADLVERRDLVLDQPECDRRFAAFVEDVAAEAFVTVRECEVDVAVAGQRFRLRGVEQVAQDLVHGVVVEDREVVDRLDRRVETDARARADREQEVGPLDVDDAIQRLEQSLVQFHWVKVPPTCRSARAAKPSDTLAGERRLGRQ